MEIRKIYDPNGEWLVNTAAFPFVDPTTGARLEPGVLTQAVYSEWCEEQPCIQRAKDVDGAAQAASAADAAAKAAADAEAAAKADAEAKAKADAEAAAKNAGKS